MSNRYDGRAPDELRPIRFTRGWARHAEGSCLIEFGATKVVCTASIDETLPPWLRNSGRGWVTAEYGMLPRSTGSRKPRDGQRGKTDGRTVEIQRLIGRSLRSCIDLTALGERSIVIDCDVLHADGGTRTASITGAWVALCEALAGLREQKLIRTMPLTHHITAVSVGIVDKVALLDLNYEEDSHAAVDMNMVMTEQAQLIEVQASGESQTFSKEEFVTLMNLAEKGIGELVALQKEAVKDIW